ncbi:MAG: phosphatase PAP2 family protein [Lentimicrobiaceae bacterium]|jgi:membrane-associated phospholipid phosphatase
MLNKLFLSVLLIFTFQVSVIAQETKHDTIAGTKGKLDVKPETRQEKKQEKKLYSISQFGRESVLFIKQPLRWKAKDWLTVGGLAGGTALLTLADQPLRDATQGNQKYYYSVPVVAGRVYGELYSIVGVAGSFGAYGMIAHDTAAKKIAIELFQAGLYSEIVTGILKNVIGRSRPYMNEGPGSFHPFSILNAGYNSFPSGHSTSAFALSTVMSRHAHSTALKIIAYTPAAFTLLSRIYQDKHWISDELLGAAIGYFVGNWVVDLHEAKRHKINVTVTSIYPPAVSIDLDSFFMNHDNSIASANK